MEKAVWWRGRGVRDGGIGCRGAGCVFVLYCHRSLEICVSYLWLGWSGWQDYMVVWSDCEVSFGRMSSLPLAPLSRERPQKCSQSSEWVQMESFWLRWFWFAEGPVLQIIRGRVWDCSLERLLGFSPISMSVVQWMFPRDVFLGRFVISDKGCDNGLFNIQLVFVSWLFPRIRSQNTSEQKTNLEKHFVDAPSVQRWCVV